MIEKSFAILFYLKKRTGYTKGELPVYLRITVNGERKETSTKSHCEPERWNSHAQRAKGTNEQSRTLNALLDALERNVHDARLKLIEAKEHITIEAIYKILTGQEEKPRMFLEVFQHHNDRITALMNTEYAPGTVERYKTTLE